ncbi:MAG: hypothetical protein ACT452_16020 [Microthrixaceae bacterium]
MPDLAYSPGEGELRIGEPHVAALAATYSVGLAEASDRFGRDVVEELIQVGAISSSGEVDPPLLEMAETVAQPHVEMTVTAVNAGRALGAHCWISYHTIVSVPTNRIHGPADVNVAASVDLPSAVATLVELGPRETPDAPQRRMSYGELRQVFEAPRRRGKAWPEATQVPARQRRLWAVESQPTDPGMSPRRLEVGDLGKAQGLWQVGSTGAEPADIVTLTPVSPTSIWAELTLFLRDLFTAPNLERADGPAS